MLGGYYWLLPALTLEDSTILPEGQTVFKTEPDTQIKPYINIYSQLKKCSYGVYELSNWNKVSLLVQAADLCIVITQVDVFFF